MGPSGLRVVDAGVATEFAASFPAPSKLWSIADLGGWKSVDRALFTPEVGAIAVIYDTATT